MTRLDAAGGGNHGKAFAPELGDAVIDALGDELAELVLADAGAVEQAARLDVMDDVHHFQHEASDAAEPRVSNAGGEKEQVLHLRRLRDLFRHHVAEGGPQIVDCLVENTLQVGPIEGVARLEQTKAEVMVDLFLGLEVQPAPIDHRSAAQDQPHALQISERPAIRQWNGRLREHAGRQHAATATRLQATFPAARTCSATTAARPFLARCAMRSHWPRGQA